MAFAGIRLSVFEISSASQYSTIGTSISLENPMMHARDRFAKATASSVDSEYGGNEKAMSRSFFPDPDQACAQTQSGMRNRIGAEADSPQQEQCAGCDVTVARFCWLRSRLDYERYGRYRRSGGRDRIYDVSLNHKSVSRTVSNYPYPVYPLILCSTHFKLISFNDLTD
jgi:hypothetical protein